MQEWKKREHTARLENAGVEKAGVSQYGKPNKKNKQSSCTHFKRDTTVRSTRSSSSM